MKLLVVSDTVTPALTEPPLRESFTDVEAVISCGDLPPEYLTSIAVALGVPLFYVCGNHDIRYQETPPAGCTNIHLRLFSFGGLNILGIEGSRWYNGGPYQYTETEIRWRLFTLIPAIWWARGVDVVVTHAPPRFIHDAEDPCHKGFRSFRHLIEPYRPSYFLHGHIHRHFDTHDARITRVKGTEVINCYGYALIDIPPETVDAKTVRRRRRRLRG